MVEPPHEERPVRAVPETGECEHDVEVAVGLPLAAPVAAERDVEVVAEPSRQRHMPPPPEVRDGRRGVRPIEILGELEAEDAAESDRHVGIPGEVEIELDGVRQRAEPRVDRRQLARVQGEDTVDDRGDAVGDDDLLR